MALALGAGLVALAIVFFIVQPVAKGMHVSLERDEDELTETEARKRVALLALRDVEYDFLAGKLDDKDYRSLKGELTAEALAALEADEKARAGVSGDADAALEAEIAEIRAGIREARFCSDCGAENEAGSRFCSSCGHAIHAAATS
ncbi:MAG TPA: zinc ribbon domain-containing protein [Longimicrobiales bacterium]|nr:zinc ribbon domain-containing protein [Longimicrobiales bacterium]